MTVNITDHNHVDITPGFQIRIYAETSSSSPALNGSLTNMTVQPRNAALTQRLMNMCPTALYPNTGFVESHCTPEDDTSGSLQTYLITCAHYVEHRDPHGQFQEARLVHSRRTGHCADHEICVDNLRSNWAPAGPRLAVCVRKQLFDGTMYGPGEGESVMRIDQVLRKGNFQGAYMVLSGSDGTTPTEVDAFNIDAWPEVGSMQSQECRDCAMLETKALGSDINSLKAEARLLTAGVGATAGILWLALLAG